MTSEEIAAARDKALADHAVFWEIAYQLAVANELTRAAIGVPEAGNAQTGPSQ